MRLGLMPADERERLGSHSEAECVRVEVGDGVLVEGFSAGEVLHLLDQFRVRASPRRDLEVRKQASRDAIADQQGAADLHAPEDMRIMSA